jgi:hypothetical protein
MEFLHLGFLSYYTNVEILVLPSGFTPQWLEAKPVCLRLKLTACLVNPVSGIEYKYPANSIPSSNRGVIENQPSEPGLPSDDIMLR